MVVGTLVFFYIPCDLLTNSRTKDFMSYAWEQTKKNCEVNDDADKHRNKLPNDMATDLLHEIPCYAHDKCRDDHGEYVTQNMLHLETIHDVHD